MLYAHHLSADLCFIIHPQGLNIESINYITDKNSENTFVVKTRLIQEISVTSCKNSSAVEEDSIKLTGNNIWSGQESMLLQLTMITKDLPSPCKNNLTVKQSNKSKWQPKLLISEVAKNKS